jgi:glycosyltransferase involved in cell wall biosynthesis
MDILIFPSYREGFPNVPLEAAAMELPVIATDVPGCVDAVLDGITGKIVPPYNSTALTNAVRSYFEEPGLMKKHGQAGRDRVLREFQQEAIWNATSHVYTKLLKSANANAH